MSEQPKRNVVLVTHDEYPAAREAWKEAWNDWYRHHQATRMPPPTPIRPKGRPPKKRNGMSAQLASFSVHSVKAIDQVRGDLSRTACLEELLREHTQLFPGAQPRFEGKGGKLLYTERGVRRDTFLLRLELDLVIEIDRKRNQASWVECARQIVDFALGPLVER